MSIGPHVLPDILIRIELRRPRQQPDWSDVGRNDEHVRGILGRTIHDDNSMRATGDIAGYFIDMRLHDFSIHPWRCDSRARPARWTNRSE